MRPLLRTSLALLLIAAWVTHASALPKGFRHLSDVDPTIEQDMRYVTAFNFVGTKIDGYNAGSCILTTRAATALSQANQRLRDQGYTLRVHDCYRPKIAVAHFVRWARQSENGRTRAAFYPRENKRELFKRGYIASKSAHSRGSTVDVSLVRLNAIPADLANTFEANGKPCHANPPSGIEQGILDMGTRFDCLDPLSATASREVSKDAQVNRQILKSAMAEAGFRNYSKEWWHYTLNDEPYKKTRFDFPVVGP